jgi:AraC family transcriptional regulator
MFFPPGLRISSYKAGMAMTPHSHREASISLVVRGGFVERIGGRERDYTRGHIAFLPAGVMHSQNFGASGARQLILATQPCWLEYFGSSGARLADAPHTNSPAFQGLADRLLLEMDTDDGFSALACDGIILEIVAAFGRTWTPVKFPPRPPAWLCAVRDFAHQNALTPPSMQAVARLAGRHEVHVAREFRRFFGASLGSYMRRLRVEHAARLLREADMSLIEIALECGFNGHPHLCRAFKAAYGVTPSHYRLNRCASTCGAKESRL